MRIPLRQRGPIGDRPASRVGRLALPAMLALLLLAAAPASGDIGATIIERCTHGKSLSGFSQADYRRALQEMPTEVEEYSPCASLISRAQLAAARGNGGSPGGSATRTATPLSPSEASAIKRLGKTGATAQRLGGQLIDPGVVHTNVSSALSSLPDPILTILAFLLACVAALGGRAIRNGIRAHRSG